MVSFKNKGCSISP